MNDTTAEPDAIDWRDHITSGYFKVAVSAHALDDDWDVVGEATVEVTASAHPGERECPVMVGFRLPGGWRDVWFDLDNAHAYAASVAAASVATVATEAHLTGWSSYTMPDRVTSYTLPDLTPIGVTVITAYTGLVHLAITGEHDHGAVLVTQPDAETVAAAVTAAIDYQAANSTWQCPECGEPVVHQPPTATPAWLQAWTDTNDWALPQWSHTDGEPLCPVMGDHGYEPTHPVPADTDGT